MQSFRLLSFLWALAGFSRFAKADLLNEILTAFEEADNCNSCQTVLLPPLQTLALLGNDAFSSTFTEVCKILGLADNTVCAGTFNSTGLILAHDLRQISPVGTTAVKFCSAVFGLCQQPDVTAYTVPFPQDAPTNATQFVSTGKTPFQVVHISDVHIDHFYTIGAEANCTENICCSNRTDTDTTSNITEPAGPFGNSKCDSPPILAQSLIEAMNDIGSGASFSIFTGDVVEGATWLVNEAEVTNDLEDWNSQMAASLQLPMYPALGNHDSAPVNSFPRNISATGVNATGSQFVFDTQSAGWEQFIGSAAADQVDHESGSYSIVVPDTTLRIISMNTQYWYPQNYWLFDTDDQIPDPNGLFAFLVDQLQTAEDAGQRAWIIGHIPSGKADIAHDQSNYYNQIIQRYNNTIAAQFAGHSHKDQFEIAYSDFDNQTADTADSIIFICPALTPTSGNPAFKLYDVDPDTYEVMDMKVYMANISEPSFQTSPTWELYYSARDHYGPLVSSFLASNSSARGSSFTSFNSSNPLDASFWHVLTEVFESNDTAFQDWNTRQSRGGDVVACTGDCVAVTICDMRAARSQNNCDVSEAGTNLRKRDQDVLMSESHACEGQSASYIFRKMVSAMKSPESGELKARALKSLRRRFVA